MVKHNTPQTNEENGDKVKTLIRKAGGKVWVDNSLSDWPENDHRIFVGNLGNDVNDKVLAAAFSHLTSYQRCKVIRDKATGKTKGYGFVSFTDPYDLLRALKEINGAYIGSRPCNIVRSKWKDRAVDSERNQKLDSMLKEVDSTAAKQASRAVRRFIIKKTTETSPEDPSSAPAAGQTDADEEAKRVAAQVRDLERLESRGLNRPQEPKQRRVFGHVAAFGSGFDRAMKIFLENKGIKPGAQK